MSKLALHAPISSWKDYFGWFFAASFYLFDVFLRLTAGQLEAQLQVKISLSFIGNNTPCIDTRRPSSSWTPRSSPSTLALPFFWLMRSHKFRTVFFCCPLTREFICFLFYRMGICLGAKLFVLVHSNFLPFLFANILF